MSSKAVPGECRKTSTLTLNAVNIPAAGCEHTPQRGMLRGWCPERSHSASEEDDVPLFANKGKWTLYSSTPILAASCAFRAEIKLEEHLSHIGGGAALQRVVAPHRAGQSSHLRDKRCRQVGPRQPRGRLCHLSSFCADDTHHLYVMMIAKRSWKVVASAATGRPLPEPPTITGELSSDNT